MLVSSAAVWRGCRLFLNPVRLVWASLQYYTSAHATCRAMTYLSVLPLPSLKERPPHICKPPPCCKLISQTFTIHLRLAGPTPTLRFSALKFEQLMNSRSVWVPASKRVALTLAAQGTVVSCCVRLRWYEAIELLPTLAAGHSRC